MSIHESTEMLVSSLSGNPGSHTYTAARARARQRRERALFLSLFVFLRDFLFFQTVTGKCLITLKYKNDWFIMWRKSNKTNKQTSTHETGKRTQMTSLTRGILQNVVVVRGRDLLPRRPVPPIQQMELQSGVTCWKCVLSERLKRIKWTYFVVIFYFMP